MGKIVKKRKNKVKMSGEEVGQVKEPVDGSRNEWEKRLEAASNHRNWWEDGGEVEDRMRVEVVEKFIGAVTRED